MKFEVPRHDLNEVTLRYSRQYPMVIAIIMQHLCDILVQRRARLEFKVLTVHADDLR